MALTAAQRTHLEQRLQEERALALRTLNQSVDDHSDDSEQGRAGDLTSMPFHVADRGTDTMQTELDAANATRVSRELAEIDSALAPLSKPREVRNLRGHRPRDPVQATRRSALGAHLRAGWCVKLDSSVPIEVRVTQAFLGRTVYTLTMNAWSSFM